MLPISLGALVLGDVFDDQQRGVGVRGALGRERQDRHAKPAVGQMGELVLERGDRRAGFRHREDHATELLREVGKLQLPLAGAIVQEDVGGRGVGVEDGEVRTDHEAADLAENAGDHRMVRVKLAVQPRVADGEADFLQHMENKGELFVRIRLAGEPLVEDGDTDERLAVEDRDGDLRAEELEFLGDLAAGERVGAGGFQDATLAVEVASDPRAEREGEVLEDALVEADRAGGAKPAVFLRERAVGEQTRRLAQEDDGAVHADDFA